jgi:hypothetical protein
VPQGIGLPGPLVLPLEVLAVVSVEPGLTKAGSLVASVVVVVDVELVAAETAEEVAVQVATVIAAVGVAAVGAVAARLLERSWRGSSASITNSPAMFRSIG